MSDPKVQELSAEEVLQKFDKESNKREMTGTWNYIISGICICCWGCISLPRLSEFCGATLHSVENFF